MTLNISKTLHSHDPQPTPTVAQVQKLLVGKGYSVGSAGADGQFGDATDLAVKRFQAHEGLVKDGIVGPKTWGILNASQGTRTARAGSEATKFADLCYRLVTNGLDGSRPAYVFGSEVSMHDPSPDKIDCSELVQWGVTQIDGNTWVDGSANQYSVTKHVSVATAIATKGALLFITNNGRPSGIHHVAISMGNGMTAEARSAHMTPQCGSWTAKGRFQYGGLIPVLHY